MYQYSSLYIVSVMLYALHMLLAGGGNGSEHAYMNICIYVSELCNLLDKVTQVNSYVLKSYTSHSILVPTCVCM